VEHVEGLRLGLAVAEAYSSFGRVWSTGPEAHRDSKMAIELALHACELSAYEDWSCLATLAAAYAEANETDEALSWAERALALAPEKDKAAYEIRVDQYRALQSGKTTGPHGPTSGPRGTQLL